MKDIKKKIGLALAVTAAWAGVFWWGGNAPGLRGWTAGQQPAAAVTAPPTTAPAPKPTRVPAVPTPWGTLAPGETPAVSGGAETPAPAAPTHRPGGAEEGLTGAEKLVLAEKRAGGTSEGAAKGDPDYSAAHGMVIDKATGKDKYLTDPVPEGRPLPVEPENAAVSDRAFTCTLSIRCDTVLENPDWLDPEKVELVPEDGV
ncbi:MAG: hypothetical protein RR216_00500, partial [Pseudoflavonifractor sp.]